MMVALHVIPRDEKMETASPVGKPPVSTHCSPFDWQTMSQFSLPLDARKYWITFTKRERKKEGKLQSFTRVAFRNLRH